MHELGFHKPYCVNPAMPDFGNSSQRRNLNFKSDEMEAGGIRNPAI